MHPLSFLYYSSYWVILIHILYLWCSIKLPCSCLALTPHNIFKCDRPYLALVTEPDAASSVGRRLETVQVVKSALLVGKDVVNLISVRVDDDLDDRMLLLKDVVDVRNSVGGNEGVKIVLNVSGEDDWKAIKLALHYGADGIHVKERNWQSIPNIRSELEGNFIIGTSCHSVESAIRAAKVGCNYMFVGTCFPTLTHPEKGADDLEGPQLVQDIRLALNREGYDHILCFAIGGINVDNCNIPVSEYKADGVAAIRSITVSTDPGQSAKSMKVRMQKSSLG